MKPKNNSNELVLTRVFDAPVELVWEAWTDPKKVAKWWGPRGFSITTKSKDLRPGGKWIYTMHGPDGVDYPNVTTYFIVEPLKRLEYDHGANENQKALFRVNVLFSENKGKTTMVMTMTFETPQIAKDMSKFIKEAGGNSTWDRLGEYLEEECHQKKVFFLNRVFEAPINKVFEMFTHSTHTDDWMLQGKLSHLPMKDFKNYMISSFLTGDYQHIQNMIATINQNSRNQNWHETPEISPILKSS